MALYMYDKRYNCAWQMVLCIERSCLIFRASINLEASHNKKHFNSHYFTKFHPIGLHRSTNCHFSLLYSFLPSDALLVLEAQEWLPW